MPGFTLEWTAMTLFGRNSLPLIVGLLLNSPVEIIEHRILVSTKLRTNPSSLTEVEKECSTVPSRQTKHCCPD